jgi:excisionase family DNA binding protein
MALLTTAEVAQLLRVHPKHVYRLLKKGLPARRVGSEWRFDPTDVIVWSGGRAPERVLGVVPPGTAALPSLVAANGDVALVSLLRLSTERGPPLIGFVQADRATGLDLLARGAVLAAGAHAGDSPSHVGEERAARIHLVSREIGLVAKQSDSKALRLQNLTGRNLASRPPSAGVRTHLDAALRAAKLNPDVVHQGALLFPSHLEVVLAVASGRAKVGLASRAWGERAGLAFHPLATEAYGLIVRAGDLGDARIVRLCEMAQGEAFRSEVGALPGYDVSGAGDIRYDA